MSLQVVSLAAPSRVNSFAPLAVAPSGNGLTTRKAFFVQHLGERRRHDSLQHVKLKLRRLPSSTCFYPALGKFQSINRPARLQATSLQAVTADNDSSSGEVVGPSAHALSLSSDELKHVMVAFFSRLQESLRKLKERGLLQRTEQDSEEAVVKLKTVDAKRVLEEDMGSKLLSRGAGRWQTLKPWVKWPLAIFVSVFMVVTAGFGANVSRDLVPLWILGPLVTGSLIRSAYALAEFARDIVARNEPVRLAIAQGAAQVLEDAKTGELGEKLKTLVGEKSRELKDHAANKRSEVVLYVKSGQAAGDFKVYMQLKFSDLSEWSTERYEDFVDWWRPIMRALVRLLKKLF